MQKNIIIITLVITFSLLRIEAQTPQIVVDFPYPGTFNPQFRHDDTGKYYLPKNYKTPESLCAELTLILERTERFIARYEGKSIRSGFAAIWVNENTNDTIPKIEFERDARIMIDFMARIAGIDLNSNDNGYSTPGQFKTLYSVKNLLNYYATHEYDCTEVYVYWQIHLLPYYISYLTSCRIPQQDMFVDVDDGWGKGAWFIKEDEIIEKWPTSKLAAMIESEKLSHKFLIYNILNKPTIAELEESKAEQIENQMNEGKEKE